TGPGRGLVDGRSDVRAEAEHDHLVLPAQVPRRADPARAPGIADAGDLRPVLARESEVPQHADEHAPGGCHVATRGVRGGELVADEAAMRVLQAARLALL